MFSLRSLAVGVLSIAFVIQDTLALSQQRNPLTRATRIDDPVLHSPAHRIHAYSEFEITFRLNDNHRNVRLTLQPNHDVLPEGAQINYLRADGSLRSTEQIDRARHKVFKGKAFIRREGSSEWESSGWARISIRQDGDAPMFEGTFRLGSDHHHIQLSKNYRKTRHPQDPELEPSDQDYMVVWRDSDIMKPGSVHGSDELKRGLSEQSTCTSDHMDFNQDPTHPVYEGIVTPTEFELMARDTSPWWAMNAATIFRRQDDSLGGNGNVDSLVSTIGETAGCPTTKRVALVGVATDCNYFVEFDEDREALTQNVIDLVGSSSELYESTFNIALGIQNLTIIDDACAATASQAAPWNLDCPSATITQRLNLFSEWRGRTDDGNAFWTLMSTCETGSAIGLAWLGQLCSVGSASSSTDETIAGANVVIRTPGGGSEWQVYAHEAGHTFGAVHDCTDSTCAAGDDNFQRCCPLSQTTCDADAAFIMNPSTSGGVQTFSQCSVGNICTAMLRGSVSDRCLRSNSNLATITGQQCGNGIVEEGEQCDCGGDEGCADNPCCDASTCQFTAGSVCDPTNEDCCSDSCQLASQGTICRESSGSCDPAETCSGSSTTCPDNEVADDGSTCGNGLQCASGQCTSRDLQCRTVLGADDLTSNDTYACDGGCTMICHSDSLLSNRFDCYSLMQYFLDGTPCEGGGICRNGRCTGSNVVEEVTDWLSENKHIVIPVASVVGGLVAIAILSCCIGALRRKRRERRMPKPLHPPQQSGWQSYGGNWRGPTTPHRSLTRGTTGYGNSRPGASRHDRETAEPMLQNMGQAPPQYTAYADGAGWTPSQPAVRHQSVRYA